MLDFLLYILRIGLWVVALMSGILSLARELLLIYRGNQIQSRSLFWNCVIIAFVVSSAILWVIEHQKALELAKQVNENRPNFIVNPSTAVAHYDADHGHTVILLGMKITNSGAPSAVVKYRIEYETPTHKETPRIIRVENEMLELQMPTGVFRMRGAEAIDQRTNVPIARGGFVAGRLPFIVPGNQVNEVADGTAKITVYVSDYLGKEYLGSFQGTGSKDVIEYVQGEPIIPGARFDIPKSDKNTSIKKEGSSEKKKD